jgi:hypothetical protein
VGSIKPRHTNPLKASERNHKHKDMLWNLTEYLAERGMNDSDKYPSAVIGYVLAIRSLWENQKPNGYGYVKEKFGEAITAYNYMIESTEEEDFQHHRNNLYQSLSKIHSSIRMFRAQRKAWEEKD